MLGITTAIAILLALTFSPSVLCLFPEFFAAGVPAPKSDGESDPAGTGTTKTDDTVTAATRDIKKSPNATEDEIENGGGVEKPKYMPVRFVTNFLRLQGRYH